METTQPSQPIREFMLWQQLLQRANLIISECGGNSLNACTEK